MATVEDATRRARACWVAPTGQRPPLVWHSWHDGALWVGGGGAEQPVPLLDGAATTVTLPAGQHWRGRAEHVLAGSPSYDGAVVVLTAARQNAFVAAFLEVWRVVPEAGAELAG